MRENRAGKSYDNLTVYGHAAPLALRLLALLAKEHPDGPLRSTKGELARMLSCSPGAIEQAAKALAASGAIVKEVTLREDGAAAGISLRLTDRGARDGGHLAALFDLDAGEERGVGEGSPALCVDLAALEALADELDLGYRALCGLLNTGSDFKYTMGLEGTLSREIERHEVAERIRAALGKSAE